MGQTIGLGAKVALRALYGAQNGFWECDMESKKLTPMKAIRAKCLDCSSGSFKEVRGCPVTDCSLWQLRFGKRPETVRKNEARALVTECPGA